MGFRRRVLIVGLVVALSLVLAASELSTDRRPQTRTDAGPGPPVAVTTTVETPTVTAASVVPDVVKATEESYGPDPLQMVTVSRKTSATGKTVIFLHGGGWRSGDRGSLAAEAAEWANTGWVSINVSYRLGVVDGGPGDGRAILADAAAVLAKYRAMPYVDPAKIVVYGESAGGHLATWLGSFHGDKVAATVAISPSSSVSGAILAGRARSAGPKVASLGRAAREFFGYSLATTDAHQFLDRAKGMFIAFSTDEWVDPDLHGRALCTSLGRRCRPAEFPGTRHAGELMDAQPQLALDTRHRADTQVSAVGGN